MLPAGIKPTAGMILHNIVYLLVCHGAVLNWPGEHDDVTCPGGQLDALPEHTSKIGKSLHGLCYVSDYSLYRYSP